MKKDFSATYSYDAIGRPCSIQRYGVTGIDGSTEKFGLLDGLTYRYDGALPSSISRESEALPFFGQIGATGTTLGYNKAGLLLTDTGRGIERTVYNLLGLPSEIEISPGRFAIRKFEKRLYSMSGSLISVSEFIDGYPAPVLTGKRTYIDRFTFACGSDGVDTLMRVDFPGGYFDSAGVHWMLPDAIGSVELVIDGNGNVEQHTGYYPYGEPWREPAGQPYLFGGKERRRFAGLGDYDFHARFLTTSTALWQAPDLHAGKYPWLSPWVFCAANPIRYCDPSGTTIVDSEGILDKYKTYIKDQLNSYKEQDSQLYQLAKYFFNRQLKTLKQLEASDVTYVYNAGNESCVKYDESENCVIVNVFEGDNGSIAHESNHAKQYDDGELSIRTDGKLPQLYDRTDEVESYNIQRTFDYGKMMFETPEAIQNDGYPTKISSKDLDTFHKGYYSPLSAESKKLNKNNRKKLIEINRAGMRPVEFYKGWNKDL